MLKHTLYEFIFGAKKIRTKYLACDMEFQNNKNLVYVLIHPNTLG
jgi:hypothetical protein